MDRLFFRYGIILSKIGQYNAAAKFRIIMKTNEDQGEFDALMIGLELVAQLARSGARPTGKLLRSVKAIVRGSEEKLPEVRAQREFLFEQGYPSWVLERITPDLVEKDLTEATRLTYWLSLMQDRPISTFDGRAALDPHPTGHEIFREILPDQEQYQVRHGDPVHYFVGLPTLLNLGDSIDIPSWFYENMLFGWQSVVRSAQDNQLYVPCRNLCLIGTKREILWYNLDVRLGSKHRALVISNKMNNQH